MWTLLVIMLAPDADPIQWRFPGFATQEECQLGRPITSNGIANWGHLTVDSSGGHMPVLTGMCIPETAPPQVVERTCTLEQPCSADLDGDGDVDITDLNTARTQYNQQPQP